jgi:hypothetical protein
LLANMQRLGPKVSMTCSTKGRRLSTVQARSIIARPEILQLTFGRSASRARPSRQAVRPASSRSVGMPAWLTITGTSGFAAASSAAVAICEG